MHRCVSLGAVQVLGYAHWTTGDKGDFELEYLDVRVRHMTVLLWM